jgi:hypothetical protein
MVVFMSREFDIEEKIYQGFLLLTAHDEFVQDVEKIRDQYNIDWITGDEEDRLYRRFFDEQNTGNLFDHKIERYDYSEPLSYDYETDEAVYEKNKQYEDFFKDVNERKRGQVHFSKRKMLC